MKRYFRSSTVSRVPEPPAWSSPNADATIFLFSSCQIQANTKITSESIITQHIHKCILLLSIEIKRFPEIAKLTKPIKARKNTLYANSSCIVWRKHPCQLKWLRIFMRSMPIGPWKNMRWSPKPLKRMTKKSHLSTYIVLVYKFKRKAIMRKGKEKNPLMTELEKLHSIVNLL